MGRAPKWRKVCEKRACRSDKSSPVSESLRLWRFGEIASARRVVSNRDNFPTFRRTTDLSARGQSRSRFSGQLHHGQLRERSDSSKWSEARTHPADRARVLQSQDPAKLNAPFSPPTLGPLLGRSGCEAAAKPAESVENDPSRSCGLNFAVTHKARGRV